MRGEIEEKDGKIRELENKLSDARSQVNAVKRDLNLSDPNQLNIDFNSLQYSLDY